MLDKNFRIISTTPDNVPIVGLIFLMAFFTWLSLKQAFDNDDRLRIGQPPKERTERFEKVMVWPDLVYTEFIATVLLGAVLVIWSIVLKAPLEQPSNPTFSPPVMKAPWYFLGLQEMLVYYDPWLAGVVLPGLIIVGLMAIPYIDRNPRGSGYYTFAERKYEIMVFMFGFMILWLLLIVIGTFLRGPNWNFFGPYETWDVAKVTPMVNVNLSEYIWVKILGVGLPNQWFGAKYMGILLRELFGFILVIGYFTALPPVLANRSRLFNGFYKTLGGARYHVMMFLLLAMMTLPIKMILRWTIDLKYIVSIPEWFFNI
ncbi:MAG: cytochrome C [Acidobacteria bacterium]|nr:cytochrome C [Acidobacteriota bacterium]MBI3656954.1 cytochrome C [Acidobacteriota bacterium]